MMNRGENSLVSKNKGKLAKYLLATSLFLAFFLLPGGVSYSLSGAAKATQTESVFQQKAAASRTVSFKSAFRNTGFKQIPALLEKEARLVFSSKVKVELGQLASRFYFSVSAYFPQHRLQLPVSEEAPGLLA